MSKALALIRFEDTKNIYLGIYSGTSDILYSRISSLKSCINPKTGNYDYFKYISEINTNTKPINYEPSDVSDIEIYSDYGGGFFWSGKGVEKYGYVLTKYQNPWVDTYPDPWTGYNEDCIEITDGIPAWAKQFMNNMFNK